MQLPTTTRNHPQPPKKPPTITPNHSHPSTTTHNHPQPSTTTYNHPQRSTTTQKKPHNHPNPPPPPPTTIHNHTQLPKNYSKKRKLARNSDVTPL